MKHDGQLVDVANVPPAQSKGGRAALFREARASGKAVYFESGNYRSIVNNAHGFAAIEGVRARTRKAGAGVYVWFENKP